MHFAKWHTLIDGAGDSPDLVAARDNWLLEQVRDQQRLVAMKTLRADPRTC